MVYHICYQAIQKRPCRSRLALLHLYLQMSSSKRLWSTILCSQIWYYCQSACERGHPVWRYGRSISANFCRIKWGYSLCLHSFYPLFLDLPSTCFTYHLSSFSVTCFTFLSWRAVDWFFRVYVSFSLRCHVISFLGPNSLIQFTLQRWLYIIQDNNIGLHRK